MPAKIKVPETAQEKPKRAALYMRVSTTFQVDKDSLPMQRQELTAYCDYVLGIHDYVYFEDAGYSGKNTDRPDYQKMMDQMRKGLFTHLVVWKIDRISRNLLDFSSMYAELKDLGVTFVSKNEQFDTSNAMGEAMLKIILVFAELERQMTSERVMATMINRANNGIWNGGRTAFGYIRNKEDDSFSIYEPEAQIVRFIFDLYEEKKSIVQVVRRMYEEKLKTRSGCDFTNFTVWTILRNPWYKGTYRYNYHAISSLNHRKKDASEWVTVDNHHEAIIDAERFDHVQKMLSDNASGSGNHANNRGGIFSGLLRCSYCGGIFWVKSCHKTKNSKYATTSYMCSSNRNGKPECCKTYTETIFGEFLINYILNIMNAQKNFSDIDSPEQLESQLLSGSVFSSVDHVEPDGVRLLYDMLSNYSGAKDSVLLAKPEPAVKFDPGLDAAVEERKKQERALERLNHIYLYSDGQMSDREYIEQKQTIVDRIQELNDSLGLASQQSWVKSMREEDFLVQASSFILNEKLQNKNYISFRALASSVDPEILRGFFRSVFEAVYLRDRKVETIVFKNGLSHTFIYKDEKADG